MAIFGKKPPAPKKPDVTPKPPQPAQAAPPAAPPKAPGPKAPAVEPNRSFLGPGCELNGEIHGAGSLECSGRITGVVELDGEILIGLEGRAKAQLTARRIVINGRLEGDAIGNEKVEVGASGHVEGDVRATAVLFAEGAFFEGNVEMRTTRARTPDPAGKEETDKGSQKADP